jgi:hypothetical protein
VLGVHNPTTCSVEGEGRKRMLVLLNTQSHHEAHFIFAVRYYRIHHGPVHDTLYSLGRTQVDFTSFARTVVKTSACPEIQNLLEISNVN